MNGSSVYCLWNVNVPQLVYFFMGKKYVYNGKLQGPTDVFFVHYC